MCNEFPGSGNRPNIFPRPCPPKAVTFRPVTACVTGCVTTCVTSALYVQVRDGLFVQAKAEVKAIDIAKAKATGKEADDSLIPEPPPARLTLNTAVPKQLFHLMRLQRCRTIAPLVVAFIETCVCPVRLQLKRPCPARFDVDAVNKCCGTGCFCHAISMRTLAASLWGLKFRVIRGL